MSRKIVRVYRELLRNGFTLCYDKGMKSICISDGGMCYLDEYFKEDQIYLAYGIFGDSNE